MALLLPQRLRYFQHALCGFAKKVLPKEPLDFSRHLANFTARQLTAVDLLLFRNIKYLLYGGALGGGKSYFLRWYAVLRLMFIFKKWGLRNVCGMLACEDYPSLKDRQLARIGREFPPWLGRMHQDHKEYGRCFILNKKWGSGVICFRNLDDPSKYQCFHPDTEILTIGGWKSVASIETGELAATMNPRTREMTYAPVFKTWEYDFDGKLEAMNSRGTPSFAVTPNHSIWASTKRRPDLLRKYRADELPQTALIPQVAGEWCGENQVFEKIFTSDGNNGRSVFFTPDDWCEFLGWFLSEGSLDPAPRYAIRISQQIESGRKHIIALFDRCGINYHIRDTEINFNNKALYKYLVQFGLSHDKFIPRDVLEWSKDHLHRLLWSLVEADGTWVNDNLGHFVTASKRMCDDISELAIKCGFRPTFSLRHDKPGANSFGDGHKPRYHVHLHRRAKDTSCGHARKQMPYKGKVYCVTVPPNHTVMTRLNGRVSWSGQSAEFAFILVDELTKNLYEVFTFLRTRLRWPGLPDIECQFVGGTNPGGIGHGWVKQFWMDKIFPEEFMFPIDYRSMFAYVKSKASDNPHLDSSYNAILQTLPESLRKAFKDGDWDIFVGQAFSNIGKETVHIISPLPIPRGAPLYMTIDWGWAAPFSIGWWWVDSDGRIYRFAEWYGWNGTANEGLRITDDEIALGIKKREQELKLSDKGHIIRLGGPDCFAKKPGGGSGPGAGQGPPTAENFAKHHLYLSPGDPSREQKIKQFRYRLHVPKPLLADYDPLAREIGLIPKEIDQLGHVYTDGAGNVYERPDVVNFARQRQLPVPKDQPGGLPMMLVYNTCDQFIRTIPNIIMDKNHREEVDTKGEDHCLHGDTMVQTSNGIQQISTLVGTTGEILTIGGKLVPYRNCRLTRRNTATVTVSFSDGSTVRCTPDHEFLTSTGIWKQAIDLLDEICYVSIQNKGEKSCWSRLFQKLSKSLTVKDIINAGVISKERAFAFIGLCGNTIMVKYQKVSAFTIKTLIDHTTRLKTLTFCFLQPTPVSMPSVVTTQHGSALCTKEPPLGMEVQVESPGTKSNTRHIAAQLWQKLSKRHASSVPPYSKARNTQSTVQGSAQTNIDYRAAWGQRAEPARPASKFSKQYGQVLSSHVQNLVLSDSDGHNQKVTKVRRSGRADVYCLTVDQFHCFTLANGVVVSNCYDEACHICMARPIAAPVPLTKQTSYDKRIEALKAGTLGQDQQMVDFEKIQRESPDFTGEGGGYDFEFAPVDDGGIPHVEFHHDLD